LSDKKISSKKTKNEKKTLEFFPFFAHKSSSISTQKFSNKTRVKKFFFIDDEIFSVSKLFTNFFKISKLRFSILFHFFFSFLWYFFSLEISELRYYSIENLKTLTNTESL